MNNLVSIIYNALFIAVELIIAIGGVISGGMALHEGIAGDNPQSKDKGTRVLIATAIIVGVLIVLQVALWNVVNPMLQGLGSGMPSPAAAAVVLTRHAGWRALLLLGGV